MRVPFLFVALGAVALTACGSSDTPPANTADAATQDATTDTPPADAGEDGTPSDSVVDETGDTADAAADAEVDAPPEPAVVHPIDGVTVDTLAGSGSSGSTDGTGAAAQFDNPVGIAFDPSGVLVVTEFDGGRVRKVTTAGATSLVSSGIVEPFGVTTTASAIFFQTVADETGTKGPDTGTIWRIVGAAAPEKVVGGGGRARGLATLADGRIVLADRLKNKVSILDPATKTVTLLAGSGTAGFADGTGAAAQFDGPYGVAVRPDGSILVADQNNHCIRQVTLAGVVTLFAGDRKAGMKDDESKLAAHFDSPVAIAIDGAGNAYVSDTGNHRIRRISAAGAVETVAGDGTLGFADGAGATAKFFGQEGIAAAADGKTLYVTDGNGGDPGPYHRIRRVTLP